MTLPTPWSDSASALDPANLDGHTIAELSDYVDAERTPTNFSIESSPGCQIALSALERLWEVTTHVLETQAAAEPAPADSWVKGIMDRIVLEARAGRDIPISHSSTTARLAMSEGAVRGMIRAAGGSVPGVLVGRCQLDGDVAVPGEPITITVDISVAWGVTLHDAADQARAAIQRQLRKHTELTIAAVHIAVQDVRFAQPSATRIEES